MKQRDATLKEFARLVGAECIRGEILISGLGLCNRNSSYSSVLSYLASKNYISTALSNPSVKALVVTQEIYNELSIQTDKIGFIIAEYPEDVFYQIHHQLCDKTDFYQTYSFQSIIGSNCKIHRTAVVEDGVRIGDNVTIGANSVINTGVVIGDNSYIGCCSIIGSQGFQILRDHNKVPYNVKHIGGTIIGDNVWIGDNVTVCNSLFEGSVLIGDNCKIDNHVYIAHNCIIGHGNVITAGAILMGSSMLKNNCWLAPGSLIMNKTVINDNALVGANSMVNSDVMRDTTVVGSPAIPIQEFIKKRSDINRLIDFGS